VSLIAVIAVLLSPLAYYVGFEQGSVNQPVDVVALRQFLAEERQAVASVRQQARAHLDALALRIAASQAQLMRLDALGERLVRVGNLDPEEFDFLADPPVGGSNGAEQGQSQDASELHADMQRLALLLKDRERKLLLLEDLLMNRELLAEVLPSGRPVNKGWLSSGYGRRTDPFTGKKSAHHGVDFAGKRGTEVVAVASGVVVRAERVASYGNLIELRHADGYTTRYAHNQKNLVAVGDVVTKGQTIALLGSTGRSNGPHVHFEVRRDGKSIDPRQFIATGS
jgi:murein DD-endopeptidase MepM/ murein hydrolase activator NlpD